MPWQGFSFTNLLILLVILAVLWPLMRWIRRTISDNRVRFLHQALADLT